MTECQFPLSSQIRNVLNTNQTLLSLFQEIYQKGIKNIPFQQLKITNDHMGTGGCAVVSPGQFPFTDQMGNVSFQKCACKRIKVEIINLKEENIVQTFVGILKEILLIYQLNQKNHPNIIKLLGISTDVEFVIILEYCSVGNLKQMITSKQVDQETKIDKIIQTTIAVLSLHEENIAHLDIKPENVLIDQNGIVKLTDFGISKELNYRETIQTMAATQGFGTPGFCAPEQYLDKLQVTKHTDI